MNEPDDDMEAALFAAGALTGRETAAFKQRLARQTALLAAVREWEKALAPLAARAGDIEPPPDLLGKVEARIGALERLRSLSRTLRPDEGPWIAMAPGVLFKELHRSAALSRWTILVDAEPGAAFPAHEHAQDEEILMISGDLSFDDVELGPGDFHFSYAGTMHAAHRTRAGCRCIIVQAL